MARYISASKLCLAILVQTYVDGYVPPSATIEVLSFVGSCIDPEIKRVRAKPQKRQETGDELSALRLEDFKGVLAGHQVSNDSNENPQAFTLWEVLVHYLFSIENLHAMCDFFSTCHDMLSAKPNPDVSSSEKHQRRTYPLAGNSPLGLFIRRVRVEFDNLQFPDVIKLWYDFERFRQPLLDQSSIEFVEEYRLASLKQQYPEIRHSSNDQDGEGSLDAWTNAPGAQWMQDSLEQTTERMEKTSLHDMERLLEFQIERMRSEPPLSMHADAGLQ